MEEDNGTLVRKKARNAGVHPEYIRKFKKENHMNEVVPGVYSSSDIFPDEMFALQQRYTKGIYSHETALILWNLTDIIAMDYVMTFPQGYNNPNIKNWNITPKYSNKQRYDIGIVSVQTALGNSVCVYNMERTLCDIVQKRHGADKSVLLNAIKRYVASGNKDLVRLMKYAKLFKVEGTIRPYIEILL